MRINRLFLLPFFVQKIDPAFLTTCKRLIFNPSIGPSVRPTLAKQDKTLLNNTIPGLDMITGEKRLQAKTGQILQALLMACKWPLVGFLFLPLS